MHREVTVEKIGYMLDRLAGCDLTAEDLETMIHKVFIASFEFEHGFEEELIQALVNARYVLLNQENNADEDTAILSGEDAEKWYCECQIKMYMQSGCEKGYAEESSSWPEILPLRADWDAVLLKDLACKEVAHHLVVMDQIRAEMEKQNVDNTDS
jgi:hypothetical protein